MGGQASSMAEGVHVVVVGGGFGGIAAAQQLKSQGFSFTLIDMRDAFHHNVAALRASVKPGFAQRTFIQYAATFGDSFVQGRVERVNTAMQTVILEGGREIHYTHLILCTGTDGNFPGKFNTVASYETAIQTYEDFVKQIQAADSVLVIGGGSTGVEMAAEIKTEYPEKRVVLVHSRVALSDPELLPSVRQEAKVVLVEKGVELLLGQKVENMSELKLNVTQKNMVVTTDKGTSLTVDLVISCIGLKINSAAYASSFSDCLAENGALKVNEHLQVKGYSNVYAVGDCADVNEPKMAYHASLHASVAVGNILNSLTENPLSSYRPARNLPSSHVI
ncbi:apoptosis-inducing factor 2 isoform X2 [Cheilinus undulatus]|uniref:apoptosis-inducing factor 2 isoform X2 n=1 Tax=Cheilinus undulatus TaxID=241271 RepID=UPI001BD37AC5|nr:apoptosis-inducing factor 2 isoform X2 [Cheilinus undulatus]